MIQRIRYIKDYQEGFYKSHRTYKVDKNDYQIYLDTINMKYRIVNLKNHSEVIDGGNTVNLNVLKQQVKEELIKLGIKFKEEDRAPKRK